LLRPESIRADHRHSLGSDLVPHLPHSRRHQRPARVTRFRLLTAGSLITGLGTQATLVALPYQVFVLTNSAFLAGLLGAAERAEAAEFS
jgi:hypothetical protein